MVNIDSDEYISLLKTKHEADANKHRDLQSELFRRIEKLQADIKLSESRFSTNGLAPCPFCSDRNIFMAFQKKAPRDR